MGGTILVTGATGTVGSVVVAELTARRAEVVAAVRNPAKAKLPEGVAAVEWDYGRPTTFDAALEGVGSLFLLTPPLDPREGEYGCQAVEAAKKAGVQRIVRLSVLGVQPGPSSGHGEVEQAIMDSALTYSILRPNFYMQNLSEGLADSIKSGALYLAAGDGRSGFVDARDVGTVAATILANGAGHENQVYSLTGGESLSYHDVAAILSRVLGRSVAYVPVSDDQMRAGMKAAGIPEFAVEGFVSFMGIIRNGWADVLTQDVENVLGRAPIRLEQFVRDYAESWR